MNEPNIMFILHVILFEKWKKRNETLTLALLRLINIVVGTNKKNKKKKKKTGRRGGETRYDFREYKGMKACLRVFKKRDRRAVEVVAAAVVMLIMADNDRKQLKGGETESGTSSTRQPHASSLLGPFAFILRHVHLGQLASERQNPGMSTLDSVCFSFDQNSNRMEEGVD